MEKPFYRRKTPLVIGGAQTQVLDFIGGLGGAMVSALAATGMLSARTWVRIPPTTSGVFRM